MILDLLSQSRRYEKLSPQIATGLAWLANFSVETVDGRYPINGEDLFALVQSYETVTSDKKRFETHRQYTDIQYVASGTEVIHYAPFSVLPMASEYNATKDLILYSDPPATSSLLLTTGMFAIFTQDDGHKPGCKADVFAAVKKVVIKVRL